MLVEIKEKSYKRKKTARIHKETRRIACWVRNADGLDRRVIISIDHLDLKEEMFTPRSKTLWADRRPCLKLWMRGRELMLKSMKPKNRYFFTYKDHHISKTWLNEKLSQTLSKTSPRIWKKIKHHLKIKINDW